MMYARPLLYLSPMEDYMLPCLNKKLFGLDCPGCGLQRSVALLWQGDLMWALQMYPAIFPLLALLGFLVSGLFIRFKYAHEIKLSLMLLTVGTILVSYLIKMNNFFN